MKFKRTLILGTTFRHRIKRKPIFYRIKAHVMEYIKYKVINGEGFYKDDKWIKNKNNLGKIIDGCSNNIT